MHRWAEREKRKREGSNGTGREQERVVERLEQSCDTLAPPAPVLCLLETAISFPMGNHSVCFSPVGLARAEAQLQRRSNPIGAFILLAAVIGSGTGMWPHWANEIQVQDFCCKFWEEKESVKIKQRVAGSYPVITRGMFAGELGRTSCLMGPWSRSLNLWQFELLSQWFLPTPLPFFSLTTLY